MFSSECRADIYMFAFQILAVARTSEGGAGVGEVTQLVRLQLQQGLSIGWAPAEGGAGAGEVTERLLQPGEDLVLPGLREDKGRVGLESGTRVIAYSCSRDSP